ncbi:MAG: bifunctional glutamate N-acetyltransferase/amino-acid acetyltransferase ArgJ [Coriobacteriia bacterium]|nr:bifunctional glutamate N-acetyltransferase/amino-acid acetyltransferase ArgJ [Coriobacteriia bacterium]
MTADTTQATEPVTETATGTDREAAMATAMEAMTETDISGGLGAVKGIKCSGVAAGFRQDPTRKDLALIVAPQGATAAAVFTQNTFCAAPVTVSRTHLDKIIELEDTACAVVINSGNANAATGEAGKQTAIRTAQLAAEALDCKPHQVLIASTGVVGVPLSCDPFEAGLPLAVAALGTDDGTDANAAQAAADAIKTTDTVSKQAAVRFTATQSDGIEVTYTVGGMCKGSGMIAPDMATMLAVIATDAALTQEAATLALREAVDVSFNRVTVDSDTSTNDSVFLFATGATPGKTITTDCPVYPLFVTALTQVCENLARQIARDGEGASKLITVKLTGALDEVDADCAARAVADSPLVKTAIAGHDANWGRIAMALGKSGADFEQEKVSIALMGLPVCKDGLALTFDEEKARQLFDELDEIIIEVDLGAGEASAQIWTCDLTHEYVSLNSDYRS